MSLFSIVVEIIGALIDIHTLGEPPIHSSGVFQTTATVSILVTSGVSASDFI
jgi:hypothetical protein